MQGSPAAASSPSAKPPPRSVQTGLARFAVGADTNNIPTYREFPALPSATALQLPSGAIAPVPAVSIDANGRTYSPSNCLCLPIPLSIPFSIASWCLLTLLAAKRGNAIAQRMEITPLTPTSCSKNFVNLFTRVRQQPRTDVALSAVLARLLSKHTYPLFLAVPLSSVSHLTHIHRQGNYLGKVQHRGTRWRG